MPTASFEDLYFLAEDFYRDFRRLRDGDIRVRVNEQRRQRACEKIYRWLQERGVWPDEETQQYIDDVTFVDAIRKHRVSDVDALNSLLDAETAEQIRHICQDARVPRNDLGGQKVLNWPLRDGSQLPQVLDKFAEQFVAFKKDSRFPSKDRPSSELKRLWFLARALAGCVLGIATRTALNIIGGTRPEEILAHAHRGKRKRKRVSRSGI